MKRKTLLFLLLFALMAPWAVQAQETVEIGDATSTTTQYTVPVNMYYHYSLTQQIFTAEEIEMAGTITSIAFDYTYTGSFTMNNVQMYMMNVDKDVFESNADMVQISDSDKVWEGTFTASGTGWVTVDLDTPFVYDGTSNLLVCFYDPTNGYPGSSYKFRTTATTGYTAIAYYSDSYTPSLTDVSTFSGSKSYYKYRNNIQLSIIPAGGSICEKPATLEVSDITSNGATFTWTGGSGSYNFAWKKASDEAWITNPTTNYEYTLTTLEPGTTYNVRVQSVCDGDAVSGWKTASFMTNFGIPLVETFATTTIPTGWTKYIGLLGSVMADTLDLQPTTSGWNFNTGNGVFDTHAKVNIYGTGCKYWLVTPTLEMQNNVQLTFDLALTKYSGTLQPVADTLQQDDRFVVLIATFGADTTLTILREWNNTGSEYVYNNITCSAVGENVAIDLSSYAGQNIAIAFYGESTATGGDNNLHIDNVSIDYIPACAKPTGVAAAGVTAHEATLSWTSDASEWIVAYKAAADDEFTEVTVSENPYTLTGLAPETAYTAKVRANCGGTLSEWSNTTSFTTTVACFVPTSFTTSNVTNHGATLTWVSDADEWIVAYKVTAEENFTEITVSDTTYMFTDLEPETGYTVKVRSNCGGEDGMSAWTTTRSFTTLEACPAPNNLVCTALTLTAATLDWNERGDATEWDLQYWKGTDTTLVTVTEKPYTLTNLIAENVYGARVRSACGSNWSSTITFEPTAKLVIGSGTATSGYLPTNTNYDYSFTQQIYTVEELGEAGLFESIDFYMTSTSAYTRNLDIYMVSIDKNAFESNTDWIAVTDADLVFSGEVEFTPQAWTTITLDAGFVYNGTQNVAIIVDDNTNVWSSRSFRTFTASAQQAIYKYQDDTDIPVDYTGAGTRTTSKNQIRILKEELSTCMKPTHLTATEVGPDFATLSWTENGEATEWTLDFSIDGETAFQINTIDNPTLVAAETELLQPSTTYVVKVRPTCDENLWSNPITITTLEACPVPNELTVSDITYNAATVTWAGYNDSYNVQLGWDEITATYLSVDFEDGAIPTQFVNDTVYAWTVTDTLTSGYCMRSGNPGVGSSTSAITITVTYPDNGTIAFDAECRGEGTSTYWDHCDFYIDEERVFYHGADLTDDGWLHYSFDVSAGEHTFTWSYTKDGSVDKPGDYFAVDNIVMSSSEVVWANPAAVENAEYTFTGLTHKTPYYVRVQGICGETETEWSEIVTFTTLEQTTVTQTLTLAVGANWVSFYVETNLDALKAALVEALPGTEITIQDAVSNTKYNPNNNRWTGQLRALDMAKMYKISVASSSEIELEGMPVDASTLTLTIKTGANWIAFPLSESMTIANAFVNFAQSGDKVQAQTNNASYNGARWSGQLRNLEPGKGYIYQSAVAEDRTFTFPIPSSKSAQK